jgi:hypothetical protein
LQDGGLVGAYRGGDGLGGGLIGVRSEGGCAGVGVETSLDGLGSAGWCYRHSASSCCWAICLGLLPAFCFGSTSMDAEAGWFYCASRCPAVDGQHLAGQRDFDDVAGIRLVEVGVGQ